MALTKATQNVLEGIVSTGSTGVSAGSFIVAQQYKITALGTTTNTQWNTIAGTTGQTYVVGSLFTAATTGASSGTGAAAVARALADRFADVVNVLDFGADPTGVLDSSPAFNLAVLESKSVCVPSGTYLIKNQIVIPNGAIIFGVSGFVPSAFSKSAILKYHSDLGITPMVWCQDSSWISFIAFKGQAKGTGTAILNKKTNAGQSSYEDMDCTIHGCTFDGWDVCVEHWNRGLWFDANVSALTDTSVSLNIDSANWIDDPLNPFDLPQQGFRAIRITNNRFHANTAAITNIGTGKEYLRGLNVIGNQIDIGDNLFSGFCYASCFTGNTLDQVGTAALDFYGNVKDISICGNTINGDTPSGQNYPLYLIRFRNTSENITIQGNTFSNTNNHGISIEEAISKSTISGNTFYNIGNDLNGTNACIRILNTASDVTISGNSFFPIVAPFGIRGVTTISWTNVIVNNNVWDTTKTLASQYLETGTNFIQGEIFSTPATLVADVNNYSPSNASLWRLSSDAARDITGILSSYKIVGRTLTIINVGSNNIILKNESGSSSTFNRIITGTGSDITLLPNNSINLIKDFISSRWRII